MTGMTMILKAAKKQYLRHAMTGILILLGLISAKAQSAEISYPYHFTYDGNPLSRIHGAADPSAHVWDGTVWVYCSQDHDGGYSNMDGYHAFSSTDMINWTDHGDVFNSSMLDESRWGSTPDAWMWAPGAARKQNENGVWTYYLYYPHNVKFNGEDWVTGVATAPTPAGPFTDQGPLRGGKMGMDPMVFVDDDGQAYIYANVVKVAKLKPDMITLAESPRSIVYDLNNDITDPQKENFGEGSYMHKKNGVYYYSYSNFHGDYQGFYAMGNNPYGPFIWKGPMAPHPQGAQDHHSVIEFGGQWYYFYHIAVSGLPIYKEGQGRIACFDRLYYNKDGTIQMVVHTRGPIKILTTNAPNGSIILDPPGGAYTPGTTVQLTVVGDLGYAFSGWQGNLSGSANPATLVVDSDKTVTATFVTTPTYTLSVESSNGSVHLVPPGGVYNSGTVVSLVPVDDFGYNFSRWEGDLTGTGNPGTITMNANKNVRAHFEAAPTYTMTTNASNGIIELNPAGGLYEEGTVVTLTAKPDFGYRFVSWGGDLAGTNNPITISMDANKNVTAIFEDTRNKKIAMAINCGGAAFRSDEGVYYSADKYSSGGGTYTKNSDISGTIDDILYQSERFGSQFSYNIPLPNGKYEVTLMFAEIYFSAAGSRIFNVEIEGNPVISNLDICSRVGPLAACEITNTVVLDDGQLNIAFKSVKENAKISAIKIWTSRFAEQIVNLHVEAENYTAMSGIGTEGTSDTGGGLNIGWIENGDWAQYTIDIPAAGTYPVDFRVASGSSGGTINMVVGGSAIGSAVVANTGGWQTWKTVSTTATFNTVGTQTLRLNFIGGTGYLYNINWLKSSMSILLLPSDLDGDNKVNLADFELLSSDWQNGYEMTDLLEMAENWLIN